MPLPTMHLQEGPCFHKGTLQNGRSPFGGGGWLPGCTLGHTHCDPKHALKQGMCLYSARSGQTEEETPVSSWATPWPGHNLERLTGTGPSKGVSVLSIWGCQGLISAHQGHSVHPSLLLCQGAGYTATPSPRPPRPLRCAVRHSSHSSSIPSRHPRQVTAPSLSFPNCEAGPGHSP